MLLYIPLVNECKNVYNLDLGDKMVLLSYMEAAFQDLRTVLMTR